LLDTFLAPVYEQRAVFARVEFTKPEQSALLGPSEYALSDNEQFGWLSEMLATPYEKLAALDEKSQQRFVKSFQRSVNS